MTRPLISVFLAAGLIFAQTTECESKLTCEVAIRNSPKASLAHHRLGEVYMGMGDLQSAAIQFRDAIDGDQEPKWVVVWCHLNLGKIFDATGERARALKEYRKAQLTEDNTRGALDEVARYIAAPFRK